MTELRFFELPPENIDSTIRDAISEFETGSDDPKDMALAWFATSGTSTAESLIELANAYENLTSIITKMAISYAKTLDKHPEIIKLWKMPIEEIRDANKGVIEIHKKLSR